MEQNIGSIGSIVQVTDLVDNQESARGGKDLLSNRSVGGTLVIHNNILYSYGIMSTEKTISFRADAEKIDALDSLAAAQDRPRSYLINEAITNYIELHAYQDSLVRKGLEDMRKGRVLSHEEVLKRLKKTGRTR